MKPPSRKSQHHNSEQPALPFQECLAKTWSADGKTRPGRSVLEHCRIAGALADKIVQFYNSMHPGILPEASSVPAKIHDVGKICPTFEAKIYKALDEDARKALRVPPCKDPSVETIWGGHAAISYAAVNAYGAPKAIANIVGAHHGRHIEEYDACRPNYGGDSWQQARSEFLKTMLEGMPSWPDLRTNPHLERVIAGLTVVADWIASGELFDDPSKAWQDLIEQAFSDAGYIRPTLRHGLTFSDIFTFEPRPAQNAFYEAVAGPGVYIMEAPMGVGKTEAALYAAYTMLEAQRCTGIYFALPTCLTSNRIYHRVNAFLSHIFEDRQRALLLHGMAWLERFSRQEMGCEAAPNASWFAQGKRGILAPFGVGTIDQALLSVMDVRHGALRTFGLAGKVVILDEVHSYDAYTGTLLDALVHQLRAIGCTVIILSATLTTERRKTLLDVMDGSASVDIGYPCIVANKNDAPVSVTACSGPETVKVRIGHLHDDAKALEEVLVRAEQGQRILWIENTVVDAQHIYRMVASRASAMENIHVGLLHSRFTPEDRTAAEERWAAALSHDARDRGKTGCIVVGTQVVEQSLDLDADFMVSRFCPSDMLFQRLGRLWRHGEGTKRPQQAKREAWLLHPECSPDICINPSQSFGKTAYIYAPYILYRSLLEWHDITEISLPGDIRRILETTYAPREEHLSCIQSLKDDMQKKIDELHSHALRGQSIGSSLLDDDIVPTRMTLDNREEIHILLIRHFNDEQKCLTLVSGEEILLLDAHGELRHWKNRAYIAAKLMKHVVRIPKPKNFTYDAGMRPEWITPWLYFSNNMYVAKLGEDEILHTLHGNQFDSNACYNGKIGFYRRDLQV